MTKEQIEQEAAEASTKYASQFDHDCREKADEDYYAGFIDAANLYERKQNVKNTVDGLWPFYEAPQPSAAAERHLSPQEPVGYLREGEYHISPCPYNTKGRDWSKNSTWMPLYSNPAPIEKPDEDLVLDLELAIVNNIDVTDDYKLIRIEKTAEACESICQEYGKGMVASALSQERAEELWDKHSEYIEDDSHSFARVAGTSLMSREQFIKAFTLYSKEHG